MGELESNQIRMILPEVELLPGKKNSEYDPHVHRGVSTHIREHDGERYEAQDHELAVNLSHHPANSMRARPIHKVPNSD